MFPTAQTGGAFFGIWTPAAARTLEELVASPTVLATTTGAALRARFFENGTVGGI
ncbi:MAG: hypothetical protein ABJA82_01030 [Myxococcales bacterium]